MKRRFTVIAVSIAAAVALLPIGSASRAASKGNGQLLTWAGHTWRTFPAATSSLGLTADNLCRQGGGAWVRSRYTSPTNIGMYMWSTLAAQDMGLMGSGEANSRLTATLSTLAGMERSHGFFYNWYDPATAQRITTWPVNGDAVRPFLSTVDNGWLAAALIMVRAAKPALAARVKPILEGMNFGFFYDAYDPQDPYVHPGQMYGGYWTDTNEYTNFHYGTLNTEPRIASYIGIAMGDIPRDHYYRMFRTLPVEYDWQEQIPQGEWHTYWGVPVYEGHYTYNGKRLVPTWGGSMFEALMVPLVVPEERWAPDSWGVTHPLYVESQIEHGGVDNALGLWGFSPSNKPEGGYREYGVDAIGMNPDGYFSDNVVTPHASFLALRYAPRAATSNLQALADRFGAFGRYGFYDSVRVSTGEVSDCVLALDQGMIMAAIANAVSGDDMRRYFSKGAVEQVVRPLIAPERFTAGRN
ncbi:hypothetical protein BH18ACT15_BH18ACT15_07510 [soil metagenome]